MACWRPVNLRVLHMQSSFSNLAGTKSTTIMMPEMASKWHVPLELTALERYTHWGPIIKCLCADFVLDGHIFSFNRVALHIYRYFNLCLRMILSNMMVNMLTHVGHGYITYIYWTMRHWWADSPNRYMLANAGQFLTGIGQKSRRKSSFKRCFVPEVTHPYTNADITGHETEERWTLLPTRCTYQLKSQNT